MEECGNVVIPTYFQATWRKCAISPEFRTAFGLFRTKRDLRIQFYSMAPPNSKVKKVEQDEDAGLMTPVSFARADLSCKDECDDAFSPVLRYSILALICLVAFLIRLFAVVRYESVGLPRL